MNAQHTPGPWRAMTKEGMAIGGDFYIWTENKDEINPHVALPHTVANARLLASAPELLAALEAVIDFRGHKGAYDWINDDRTVEAFNNARSAIARAKGQA